MKIVNPTVVAPVVGGSFTRASVATYYRNNKLTDAAINEPRFSDSGLLVESSIQQLVHNSETFSVATDWTIQQGTISKTFIGPDGLSNSATSFTESSDVTAQNHGVNLRKQTIVSGNRYVLSLFVKPNTGDRNIRLIWGQSVAFPTGTGMVFNPALKTITLSGSMLADDCGFLELPNGWFRIWISGLATGNITAANLGVVLFPNIVNNSTYIGNGTSSFLFYGFQLEQVGSTVTTPSSYIRTTGTQLTRSADVITGTGLVYTNAVQDNPTYSAATTYAILNRVVYNYRVYESLQNTNLNHQPDISPTWWLDLGSDNRTRAIDGKVSTVSSNLETLKFIIQASNIDSIGLLSIKAKLIDVSVVDASNNKITYFAEYGLSNANIANWYDYFYLPVLNVSEPITQVVINGVIMATTQYVAVELLETTGLNATLGSLLVGAAVNVGLTQYGLQAGIVDYSTKEADEFGNITITERKFSKRMQASVAVSSANVNAVQRLLYAIRAKPVLWIGSDDLNYSEASVVYGFYKDFSTTISYPTYSLCTIEIEGLT